MAEYHSDLGDGTIQILEVLRKAKAKLEHSKQQRIKPNFAADHIYSIDMLDDGSLVFELEWGRQNWKVEDLNYREVSESIRFLERSSEVFLIVDLADCIKHLTKGEYDTFYGLYQKIPHYSKDDRLRMVVKIVDCAKHLSYEELEVFQGLYKRVLLFIDFNNAKKPE